MIDPHRTEGLALYFPPELLQASLVRFQQSIDGYLLDARIHSGGYRAVIFFDSGEAFDNGDVINTGEVVHAENEQSYMVITTADGRRYVVVSYLLYLRDDADGIDETRIMSLKHYGADNSGGKA